MAAPVSLTTIAALAIAGVGGGLYLGKSAVSEIDPVYFSSPLSSKFYSDLVPGSSSTDAPKPQLQSAAYFGGLGDGCVLCEPAAEEYYRVPDYSGGDYEVSYASYVSVPAEEIVDDASAAIEEEARRAALQDVERYAHFQVASDEKPLRLASAAPAKAEEADEDAAAFLDAEPADEEPAPAI